MRRACYGVAVSGVQGLVQCHADTGTAHGLDGSTIAIKKMAGLVQQQAYILSFIDIFLLLTVLFGSLVVCAFAISKPQSGVGGGGGH